MSRLFLSRNIEDGNGRAGVRRLSRRRQQAAAAHPQPGGGGGGGGSRTMMMTMTMGMAWRRLITHLRSPI
jgi:hypothetical protein